MATDFDTLVTKMDALIDHLRDREERESDDPGAPRGRPGEDYGAMMERRSASTLAQVDALKALKAARS